jgi:hypothetical protein
MGSSLRAFLYPERFLNQPADRFGAIWKIGLPPAPFINRASEAPLHWSDDSLIQGVARMWDHAIIY